MELSFLGSWAVTLTHLEFCVCTEFVLINFEFSFTVSLYTIHSPWKPDMKNKTYNHTFHPTPLESLTSKPYQIQRQHTTRVLFQFMDSTTNRHEYQHEYRISMRLSTPSIECFPLHSFHSSPTAPWPRPRYPINPVYFPLNHSWKTRWYRTRSEFNNVTSSVLWIEILFIRCFFYKASVAVRCNLFPN